MFKEENIQTVASVWERCIDWLRLRWIELLAEFCIISHNVIDIDFSALYDGAEKKIHFPGDWIKLQL